MPIYEYHCESCDTDLEVIQKISDPAPEKCENCGAGPLKKKMSLTSFQLKGGGWYSDGYSSTSSSKSESNDSSSKPAESSSKSDSTSSSKTSTPKANGTK